MSDDEFSKAVAAYKDAKAANEKLKISDIKAFEKQFKKTCETTKRQTQIMDAAQKTPCGRMRSGKPRSGVTRATNRAVYSDGRFVNKGIDDFQEKFDLEERNFLKKAISRVKNACDLKYEHLRYLVMYVYLDDLKKIKGGEIKSQFHDDYQKRDGESKMELLSEIRTSLFTNEQRDYISGLLQGAFQTTIKDDNGDIKHAEISYVDIVMLAECVVRIVKHVYDFDTIEEAQDFMVRSSRETLGLKCDD